MIFSIIDTIKNIISIKLQYMYLRHTYSIYVIYAKYRYCKYSYFNYIKHFKSFELILYIISSFLITNYIQIYQLNCSMIKYLYVMINIITTFDCVPISNNLITYFQLQSFTDLTSSHKQVL